MLPLHHNRLHKQALCRPKAPARAGFTFVELISSLAILTMTMTVLSGLMLAISQAWDHATALEESRKQSQATISRIRWMVQQAGTYRLSGQATTLGVATVSQTWLYYQAPSILVIWSGGATGGMADLGVQSRLPVASELVVYAPDAQTPSKFVELTFPGNSTQVDFRASSFTTTINTLMTWTNRKSVKLCDRLRVTTGQNFGWYTVPSIGNSRFELTYSPTDSQLTSASPGSQNWNDLPWAQGMVGADYGLRTANLQIELLLERDPAKPQTDDNYTTALPFYGSANRRYVFQP
jgi:hypothetical protein